MDEPTIAVVYLCRADANRVSHRAGIARLPGPKSPNPLLGRHLVGSVAVVETSSESLPRLILCLVADEDVIDRFPTAVRFLQVGLVDEPVDVILVVQEHNRAKSLVSGPTSVVEYRKLTWPFRHWIGRNVIAEVGERINALHHDGTIIVQGLTLSTAPMAASIATQLGAELVLEVASVAGLQEADSLRALSQASAFIAPTEAIRSVLKASPLEARSVEIIRPGVQTDDAPAAFSDTQRAPSLVFAGALHARSGVDTLLRATKRVLRRHPNVQLFVIGKGPAEGDFRHLARSLDISLNVTFAGRLEPSRPALRAADIFCLPSASPAFREEPIHAMASGLAIVAARGGQCDGLVHRQTALLFAEQDEEDMAAQVCWYLENPRTAKTIGATAQAYAREHHSVSRMVSDYLRVYRRLAGRLGTLSLSPN